MPALTPQGMFPFRMMSGPATGSTGRGTWGSGMNGVVLSVLSGYLGSAAVPPGEEVRDEVSMFARQEGGSRG